MINGPDLRLVRPFVKSSFSNGGDNCVEVARTTDGRVLVRHSQHTDRPAQVFTCDEWRAFVAGIRAGEFDF